MHLGPRLYLDPGDLLEWTNTGGRPRRDGRSSIDLAARARVGVKAGSDSCELGLESVAGDKARSAFSE